MVRTKGLVDVRGVLQVYVHDMAHYWVDEELCGSPRVWVCVCICVAIRLLVGKCNDSAHAANVSTSGEYILICSGSGPSSVGLSCALVLVSEGAGVLALDRAVMGD